MKSLSRVKYSRYSGRLRRKWTAPVAGSQENQLGELYPVEVVAVIGKERSARSQGIQRGLLLDVEEFLRIARLLRYSARGARRLATNVVQYAHVARSHFPTPVFSPNSRQKQMYKPQSTLHRHQDVIEPTQSLYHSLTESVDTYWLRALRVLLQTPRFVPLTPCITAILLKLHEYTVDPLSYV